ncbi:hypothetical protein [Sphingobium sp. BS19]|uniref:hypothetical protein n=1 Tax=Sphingobium sp. BS19 TaxID=3018973 RepID=UPI0022EE0A62|nr:hypothetical protein [Sphingobium sp. BS19]GLI99154.1 hypothetical protein Sbs19_29720 [Sphingobium sp. BS19]
MFVSKKKHQQVLDRLSIVIAQADDWQDNTVALKDTANYWHKRSEALENDLELADARVIELASALTEISNMRTPSCAHIGKRMADVADRVLGK